MYFVVCKSRNCEVPISKTPRAYSFSYSAASSVAEHNLGDKAARAVYYRDRRLNFTTFATSVKAVASQPHSGLLTFRASSTSSNFRDAAFFAPLPENLHLLDYQLTSAY